MAEITLGGNPVHTVGELPEIGTIAPDFEVTGSDLGEITRDSLAGKRVVVIGSGATAATLIPAIASECAHATMLQRSPTYILPQPGKDPLAVALRRLLNWVGPRFIFGR